MSNINEIINSNQTCSLFRCQYTQYIYIDSYVFYFMRCLQTNYNTILKQRKCETATNDAKTDTILFNYLSSNLFYCMMCFGVFVLNTEELVQIR